MFTFKIFEIPDGKSTRMLSLTPRALELGDVELKQGKIALNFEKTSQFIRVLMSVEADVNLICDRSLELFSFYVNQPYQILFKFDNETDEEHEQGSIRKIDNQRNEINIEQDVLDTILVHIPAKKLHPRFLDDEGNAIEFETQSFGKPNNDENYIDPRWAALKELKNN